MRWKPNLKSDQQLECPQRARTATLPKTRRVKKLLQHKGLERAKGIEPSYAAWEAAVLPLNYARIGSDNIRGHVLRQGVLSVSLPRLMSRARHQPHVRKC